ncbi:GNAT family N-acetyltransferase [Halostella salina]|uniref:GNAT family N-acetyltransferase n=1 Tax=Halostella salina TaxID=1547897 RepID=UPI000EF80863|nr:GNAT family N-acetyltransferase [Halostella salina]
MSVEVRPATPADVPGIRRVAHAGWNAAYEGVLSASTRKQCLAEWYAPTVVERAVTDPDVSYFVADDDGVVGYASGDTDGGEDLGRLSSIYVHPDRWGEGVGTELLDAVESALADRGIDAVRVLVLAENDVGVRFYRARGYDCVDSRTAELGGETCTERVFRGSV